MFLKKLLWLFYAWNSGVETLYSFTADCNGAANILKKVAATLKFSLKGVSRGALTTPLRVHFWMA